MKCAQRPLRAQHKPRNISTSALRFPIRSAASQPVFSGIHLSRSHTAKLQIATKAKLNQRLSPMAQAQPEVAVAAGTSSEDEGSEAWGGPGGNRMPGQKRSVAMHVAYVGSSFRGLQLCRNFPPDTTVEGVLERALLEAGLIAPSNYGDLFKIKWTRSSRTDKGVHSLATVIGVRVVVEELDSHFDADPEGLALAARINRKLPETVRVLCVQRVNKKFNARRFCQDRSYEYLMPASVLGLHCDGSEHDQQIMSVFRDALSLFPGKHPFHNYTVRRKQYLETPPPPRARGMDTDQGDTLQVDSVTASDDVVTHKGVTSQGATTLDSSMPSNTAVQGVDTGTAVSRPLSVTNQPPNVSKRLPRRKGAEDEGVVDDDGGDADADLEDLQGSSFQAELEAELGSEGKLDLGFEVKLAGGEAAGLAGQARPQAKRWTQLCAWQGEMSEKDRVGVRHYRVIREFTADDPVPLVPGGVPCIRLRVTGLSFMLNQIRHMIGGAVAVTCGYMPMDLLKASLSAPSRVSVPKAPPHTLCLAGVTFPPFRRVGSMEARAARFSGESLELREAGQAAQQAFRESTLDSEMNRLLSHSDWQLFAQSLEWFYWDPQRVKQVLQSHAEWQLQRQVQGKHKGTVAADNSVTPAHKAEESTSTTINLLDPSHRSPPLKGVQA